MRACCLSSRLPSPLLSFLPLGYALLACSLLPSPPVSSPACSTRATHITGHQFYEYTSDGGYGISRKKKPIESIPDHLLEAYRNTPDDSPALKRLYEKPLCTPSPPHPFSYRKYKRWLANYDLEIPKHLISTGRRIYDAYLEQLIVEKKRHRESVSPMPKRWPFPEEIDSFKCKIIPIPFDDGNVKSNPRLRDDGPIKLTAKHLLQYLSAAMRCDSRNSKRLTEVNRVLQMLGGKYSYVMRGIGDDVDTLRSNIELWYDWALQPFPKPGSLVENTLRLCQRILSPISRVVKRRPMPVDVSLNLTVPPSLPPSSAIRSSVPSLSIPPKLSPSIAIRHPTVAKSVPPPPVARIRPSPRSASKQPTPPRTNEESFSLPVAPSLTTCAPRRNSLAFLQGPLSPLQQTSIANHVLNYSRPRRRARPSSNSIWSADNPLLIDRNLARLRSNPFQSTYAHNRREIDVFPSRSTLPSVVYRKRSRFSAESELTLGPSVEETDVEKSMYSRKSKKVKFENMSAVDSDDSIEISRGRGDLPTTINHHSPAWPRVNEHFGTETSDPRLEDRGLPASWPAGAHSAGSDDSSLSSFGDNTDSESDWSPSDDNKKKKSKRSAIRKKAKKSARKGKSKKKTKKKTSKKKTKAPKTKTKAPKTKKSTSKSNSNSNSKSKSKSKPKPKRTQIEI